MRTLPVLLLLLVACKPPPDGTIAIEVDPDRVPFPVGDLDLVQHVNPFLGTEGSGNVIPGALRPHGMVRASPDTRSEAGAIGAYHAEDTHLEGYTHTHLEGPGGGYNGYSQILLLPQAGERVLAPSERPVAYSHDDERASPGLYEVTQADGVRVEVTATAHAAAYRLHFPAGPARLLLDLGHSKGLSEGGELVIDGATLSGFGAYNVHPVASAVTANDGRTGHVSVYTHIEVNLPPTEHGVFQGRTAADVREGATDGQGRDLGGWVGWTFDAPTTVEVRVGISFIDTDQARLNVELEALDISFDQLVQAGAEAWNEQLNRVRVEADDDTLTQIYTALYRAAFQPADHTEPGGPLTVGDQGQPVIPPGRFMVATSGAPVVRDDFLLRFMTDDWCMWDTFRTSHPLATLWEPDTRDDVARSMLVMAEEGGWLPKCTWTATGYSRVMIGNHAVPILADMLVKGLDRFDHDAAWAAIDRAGTDEVPEAVDGLCGYTNLGTPPAYLELGYVPDACDPDQAASMTLEHAYDDWASARFAEVLGRDDDRARYDLRGAYWRNTFNADGWAQSRHADGSWVEPFDLADDGTFNGFVEADSSIYSFFVPHDVPNLVEVMGGEATFVERLDTFFDEDHFDPTNQPSFHIPWLYAALGDADTTSERLRALVAERYGVGRRGLPGNDDAGSTSALLVFTMMGLYPLAPGAPTYLVTTPMVDEFELLLHPGYYDGGSFTVRSVGDPATMPYVQSATLNGEALQTNRLTHAQIVAGGVLELTLGTEPAGWGRGG